MAKTVEESKNSLVFKIDSVIITTKSGETNIYRAIQELKPLPNEVMETTELVIDSKLQSNLNLLIENTLEEEIKWKKTWIPSLIITPFNQKKGSTKLKKSNHTTQQ